MSETPRFVKFLTEEQLAAAFHGVIATVIPAPGVGKAIRVIDFHVPSGAITYEIVDVPPSGDTP